MPKKSTYIELKKRIAELEQQVDQYKTEVIKYHTLFNSFPHGITVSDTHGNILETNAAAEKLLGISKNVHEKRKIDGQEWRIIRPDGSEMPPEAWASVIALKEKRLVSNSEMGIVKNNNETIWLNVTAAPIPIKSNGVVVTYNDITEKKQAEKELCENENRFRNFFENSGFYGYIISPEGNILEVNDAALSALGYSKDELIGNSFTKIYAQESIDKANRLFEEWQETGQIHNAELAIKSKNGNKRWVILNANAVRDDAGNLIHSTSIQVDITNRKLSEERLEMYKNIVSSTTDGIAFLDKNYKYIVVNDAYENFSGIPRNKFIGMTVSEYLGHDFFKKYIKPNFDRCLKGEVVKYQEWFEYPTLGRRFMEITYYPYLSGDNGISGIIANTRDITAQQKSEENNRQFQKMLARTESIAHIGSWEWEITTDKVTWSEGLFHIFQYNPGDGVPSWKEHSKLYHPEDFALLQQAVENAIINGASYELELRAFRKDGEIRTCQAKGIVELGSNGKPVRLCGFLHDITDLKRAEKQLQLTLDATADGIWSWKFKTNELYFSPNYYKMLGYMPNEFPADFENWLNLIHPDDREGALAVSNEFLKTKPDLYQNEFRLRTKNGNYRWARTIAKVVERDENGDAVYMIGNHEDITERKLALDALIKEQARFELAMRSVNDGLWDWNLKTNEIYYSPVWKKLLGYEDHEIENKFSEWERLTDPKDVKASWEMLNEVLKGKKKHFENEFKMLHKEGHWVDILARADVINDENGEGARVIGTHVDITDRKRLEKQLQQSQRMESIRTLAGGIAHDFNNILFPIVGHTEMLMEDIPQDSPFRGSLNEIYIAALRAKDLVQQILAFSRQEASELKLMKMQVIVKEALKLIRSTIPTTISLGQNIQSDCSAIKADPTQIHQVVMNLTTNAYHAMENDGGELKVGLKEVELGRQELLTHTDLTPGRYACLTVSDTGIGINKNVIDKIFDPFFTTKEKGKGTGMGLSVIHGIVKNMNGSIKVDSEPGRGTEFHVYLPIAESAFETEKSLIKESIQGGDERILIIDDEEVIIKMEKQSLERLGYHVTSHISSIEALEIFRANPDKFDLIITDIAMPKMPGDKLAMELIKIRPDIPILLCTGFSETVTEEKTKHLGIKNLLLKPIIIKDLARKIREILDKGYRNK